jgi:hypothetical protein
MQKDADLQSQVLQILADKSCRFTIANHSNSNFNYCFTNNNLREI